MPDKVATFSINLDGNAKDVSKETAAELETLRSAVEKGQRAIKDMVAAQRSLRGASDEVKDAKEQLKAKIEAERGAVSQANLALLKQGVTYEALALKARQKEKADRGVAEGLKSMHGPASELTEKLEKLS